MSNSNHRFEARSKATGLVMGTSHTSEQIALFNALTVHPALCPEDLEVKTVRTVEDEICRGLVAERRFRQGW